MTVYDKLNGRTPLSGWDEAVVVLADRVGEHEVETVDEARASYEAERRGPIESVTMVFRDVTGGTHREFRCSVNARGGSVFARDLEEPEVDGVVSTVRKLADEARNRRRTERLRGVLLGDAGQEDWWAIVHNPWVVRIGGGLIMAALLAWWGLSG